MNRASWSSTRLGNACNHGPLRIAMFDSGDEYDVVFYPRKGVRFGDLDWTHRIHKFSLSKRDGTEDELRERAERESVNWLIYNMERLLSDGLNAATV